MMDDLLLTVRHKAFLPLVNDFIHDQSILVSNVVHDRPANTVAIPFMLAARQALGLKLRKRGGLFLPTRLCIRDVEVLELSDTHGIETNELNAVEFDDVGHRVVIRTNVPMDFVLTVRRLCVAVTVELP